MQIKKPYLAIGLFCQSSACLRGLLGRGYDGNSSTLLRTLDGEYYFAGDLGKQGVILAHADVVTGMEFSAALTHDDAARDDLFAALALHAQTF